VNDAGSDPTRLLVLDSARRLEEGVDVCELEVKVPPNLVWFRGHFPGDPALAAVVQLCEVVEYVSSTWSDLKAPRAMTRLKFRNRILPAAVILVRLRRAQGSQRVSFELSGGETPYSSGTLEYAP
jgi:3-hydroxymyristoyl/3-hydroxydecanoyl-(acyl carrier protein) dehydratase